MKPTGNATAMRRGVFAALASALLFGAATPLAKPLLEQTGPWLLAALLYLGSGLGFCALRRLRHAPPVRLSRTEWRWLALAVGSGGVLAPVLLLFGLRGMPASSTALLLNAEGVFTALLAWGLFHENVDRRVAAGMLAIVGGGVLLAWSPSPSPDAASASGSWPMLAVLGACLLWALDNNFTRHLALVDAGWIAMIKGLAAGGLNLALALWVTPVPWPGAVVVTLAAVLGFASYGASLVLFITALRELGTARTSAYFSVAPFFGAALAVGLLGEPLTWQLAGAGALMAVGVVLHLTERHEHWHEHEALRHAHTHTHGAGDSHHDHAHDAPVPSGTRHTHTHGHDPMRHRHAHYPDAHHRHGHRR